MTRTDQDIRKRLLAARLPAMPPILLKLLEMCQADVAGMAEMAQLVGNDAAMSAKVLNVANSAAYYRGARTASLVQALHTLGADMLKTLVISESVLQTFQGFPYSTQVDLRMFWKHSLLTAVFARELAKAMQYAQTEEAYLAGLMHDVGRLALLAAAPDEYLPIFYSSDDEALGKVEQRGVQMSHTEAGAWLVERWNLDSFLADAILYHHEPAGRLDAAHPLIRIVHLAHELASQDILLPLAPAAGALCKLPVETLAVIQQGAVAQVERAAGILGIDLSGLDDWEPPVHTPAAPVTPMQQRMNEEVRHMALSSEVGQSFTRPKDDVHLLKVIRQNAHVLYEMESTIVLLMNGNAQALVGVSVAEHLQRLAEFSVKLDAGGGIAQSAVQQKVAFLSRQDGLATLAEEQLMRIFGVECLVAIPLCNAARCLGVLVGGVPAHLLADLRRRERFLLAYGAQAATALAALTSDRAAVDRRIEALQTEHRESARRMRHEVNNPLAIIKNYLGVLDDKLARQEAVDGEIGLLHEEIDRVGNILSDFAGATPAAPRSKVELNKVVGNVVRLFRESKFLPPSVEISAQLAARPCEMEGSADPLKQILVNLIKNAVEAMPRGGRIEVRCAGTVTRAERAYYALSVKDNGPGIPAAQRSRLFSPVQSTKAGSNRGIGLSIVHGLVTKLGGLIECQSDASGTVFEICLPVPGALSATAPYAQKRV